MRKLTIIRHRAWAGNIIPVKIYVEDATGKTKINGVNCRKLGSVKNGSEATFEIPTDAVKIFAIEFLLEKDLCCDFYELEAGEEDVVLHGAVVSDPLSGNPFRFHSNNSVSAKALRAKNRKKCTLLYAVVFVVAFCVGVVGGLMSSGVISVPKTIRFDELSIKVTTEFSEAGDMEAFGMMLYDTEDVGLVITKDSSLSGVNFYAASLPMYADVIENTLGPKLGIDIDFNFKDGLCVGRYTQRSQYGENVVTYCFLYKSDEAFWILEFAVMAEQEEEYKDDIYEWAQSVKFS